jgi:hypothetical protein
MEIVQLIFKRENKVLKITNSTIFIAITTLIRIVVKVTKTKRLTVQVTLRMDLTLIREG